jgi:hypothetical protein
MEIVKKSAFTLETPNADVCTSAVTIRKKKWSVESTSASDIIFSETKNRCRTAHLISCISPTNTARGVCEGRRQDSGPPATVREEPPQCTHIGPALPGNSGTRLPEISHSCLEMVEWKEETELS